MSKAEVQGTERVRRGGIMDQKQEAELGLHLPWLVLLDTYRLLPWAMALCVHLPSAPAPETTALLLKGLKRNVEKGGGA